MFYCLFSCGVTGPGIKKLLSFRIDIRKGYSTFSGYRQQNPAFIIVYSHIKLSKAAAYHFY